MSRPPVRTVALALALTVVPASTLTATAQPVETVASEPPAMKRFSITWSPIHLVLPVVELMAEYVVMPKLGVAVIAGAGRVSNETDTITATAYEAGAQVNYYVLRPSSGLHVGAEAIYMHVGDIEQDASVTAAGLSLGPYAGYKVTTSIGFTFVAQLGVQFYAVRAQNDTQMADDSDISPLLNLNAGWSF